MVEDALRERLAARVGAEVGGEAEGLVDGQVRLHVEHGRARHLRLLEDVAAPTVQHAVDAAHGVLGTLWRRETRKKLDYERRSEFKIGYYLMYFRARLLTAW